MPANAMAPVWSAPSIVLVLRPQRVATIAGPRTRGGRLVSTIPRGPSWFGCLHDHRARYNILDIETSRLSQLGQVSRTNTYQHELFTPRPARSESPELVQLGTGVEASCTSFGVAVHPAHDRMLRKSNCSTFADPALPSRPHGHATFSASQYRTPTATSGTRQSSANRVEDRDPPRWYPGRTNRENPVIEPLLSRSCSGPVIPTAIVTHGTSSDITRKEYPDFLYAHAPDRYPEFKTRCSRSYKDMTSFIRHSLEKHQRRGNMGREGISLERLLAASNVKVPSSVPKEQRDSHRYRLVREQLLDTPFDKPILVCENEGLHRFFSDRKVVPCPSENGKRPRSRTASPDRASRPRLDFRPCTPELSMQAPRSEAPPAYLHSLNNQQSPMSGPTSRVSHVSHVSHTPQISGPPAVPSPAENDTPPHNIQGFMAQQVLSTCHALQSIQQSTLYTDPTPADMERSKEFYDGLVNIQAWAGDLGNRVTQRFFESLDLDTTTNPGTVDGQDDTQSTTQMTPSASTGGHSDGFWGERTR